MDRQLAAPIYRALRALPLVAWWLVVLLLMRRDAIRDPYDATLSGTARYGHNSSGALENGLLLTLVELTILLAILRPWSYSRSWVRPLAAFALLVPWLFFSLLITVHAGGVMVIHLLWVAGLTVAMAGLAAWSGLAKARQQ